MTVKALIVSRLCMESKKWTPASPPVTASLVKMCDSAHASYRQRQRDKEAAEARKHAKELEASLIPKSRWKRKTTSVFQVRKRKCSRRKKKSRQSLRRRRQHAYCWVHKSSHLPWRRNWDFTKRASTTTKAKRKGIRQGDRGGVETKGMRNRECDSGNSTQEKDFFWTSLDLSVILTINERNLSSIIYTRNWLTQWLFLTKFRQKY